MIRKRDGYSHPVLFNKFSESPVNSGYDLALKVDFKNNLGVITQENE